MNIFDTIGQYLQDQFSTTIRGGPGYQEMGVNPQTSPRGRVDDYVKGRVGPATGEPAVYYPQAPSDQYEVGVLDKLAKWWNDQTSTSIKWDNPNPPEDLSYLNEPSVLAAEAPQPITQPKTMEEWAKMQSETPIDENYRQYLEANVLPLTRAKGIPDSLAAAQAAVESGRSYNEDNYNNPFGLMWEGQRHAYGSMENAVNDYDLTLRDIISRNMGIDPSTFSYSNFTPEDLLKFLIFNAQGDISNYRYEAHEPDATLYQRLIPSVAEWSYYK